MQVHDLDVDRAEPGQRVAVSLPGVERATVSRGEALVAPAATRSRTASTSRSRSIAPIEDGARVQVHLGTVHAPRASCGSASGSRNCGSRRPSSPPAATASSSVARRRSAAGRRRPGAAASPRRGPRRTARSRRRRFHDLGARSRRLAALRERRRARRGRASRPVGVLDGVARSLRRTICARGSPPPTRSIRAFRFPPSRGSRTCWRAFRSSGAARSCICREPSRRSTGARRTPPAGGGARDGRCPRDEGGGRRARALPRGERAARPSR